MIFKSTFNALTLPFFCGLVCFFALGLVASAFVLEYGFQVLPCQMCWWQRYVHWAMALVAFVGLWRWSFWAVAALADLALVGGGIALWQALAEHKLVPLPESCRGAAGAAGELAASAEALMAQLASGLMVLPPRCDEVSFRLLGLSLAEWNVLAMAGVFAVALSLMIREWKKWN